MTQIAANKGQLCFLRIYIFYFTDTLNAFVLVNIATQPINGIGWVNDHSAVFQAFGNLLYQTGLRVFGMYLY